MITLTDEELRSLTGYKLARLQLDALHLAGFTRARIVLGKVVLERAHYEAVCRGQQPADRPRVRLVRAA